jgi:hypothetical protein
MTFMQGTYLRVLTPETINGVYPKQGEDGRQLFKETHLPISARPFMEQRNKKLPNALKMKIEVVMSEPVSNGYKTIEPDEAEQLRAKIAELEAQNAALTASKAEEAGTKQPAKPKTAAVQE